MTVPKKMKARKAHKKKKAHIKERHKGTQARKAREQVKHVGTKST